MSAHGIVGAFGSCSESAHSIEARGAPLSGGDFRVLREFLEGREVRVGALRTRAVRGRTADGTI